MQKNFNIAVIVLLVIITIIMIFFAVVVGTGVTVVNNTVKTVTSVVKDILPDKETLNQLKSDVKKEIPVIKEAITTGLDHLHENLPHYNRQLRTNLETLQQKPVNKSY